MTDAAPGTLPDRPAGGGIPARRAVIRWAVRLFRREWRQQVLVLTLLTLAVAAAVFGVSATYNLASSSDAMFGRADQLMRLDGSDPTVLASRLSAAQEWFGTIEAIGHRYVQVPGRFDPVDVRAQNPNGTYGAPMLALREGRYPGGAGEVALTDGAVAVLRTALGSTVSLDGRTRVVVGVVENPHDLADEFALVDVTRADAPQLVTVLVFGDRDNLEAFRATIDGPLVRESRTDTSRTVIALTTLALATVGLLLVSLVAAAGFVVVAQRRLRQLGMLAATGATRRHLRLAMLANGTLVGTLAAIVGTAIGVAAWVAAAGSVETSAGHRIGRFDLPWWTIVAAMMLAMLSATASAWWPARSIVRIPIMSAISARPPQPKPARRSALLAAGVLALGVSLLVWSGATNLLLAAAGILATAAGVLLIAPLAIRLLAASRAGLPIAVRLALTDLVRYQARAGAALAAIGLALGICFAVVAGSAAAEHNAREAAGLGNLASSDLLIRIGEPEPIIPERTSAQVTQLQTQAEAIAASLGGATVIPLDMAVVASSTEVDQKGGPAGHPAVEIGVPIADNMFASYSLYVATPDVLRLYGVNASAIAPGTDVLTARTDDVRIVNIPERTITPIVQPVPNLGYTSTPNLLLTEDAMSRHGWQPARVGWLMQANHPLSSQEQAQAQSLAADAGFTIEFRRDQPSLERLRTGATGAGVLLALGVLATTVGLIRGEGAGDLRTLTAVGAPKRTRRTLTATTAGALALLGSILGVAGAYIGLASLLHQDLGDLADVPVTHLAALTVGFPLIAAAAGWLLAGKQPASFARRRLD